MEKLRLIIINTLFVIFTTNSIGMICTTNYDGIKNEEGPRSEPFANPYPSPHPNNKIRRWKCMAEVQESIHNKYENTKFEVKRDPILLENLTEKILSFINGDEPVNYIVIGIGEERDYKYKIMESRDFKSKLDMGELEHGIYKISEGQSDKYYQVINNKESELTLIESYIPNLEEIQPIPFASAKILFNINNNKKYLYKIMENESYTYMKVSKRGFKNGIYRIISKGQADKYYHVLNNKELDITSKIKQESKELQHLKDGSSINIDTAEKLFNIINIYRTILKADFKPETLKNGIYRVISEGQADKYYHIFNDNKGKDPKESELILMVNLEKDGVISEAKAKELFKIKDISSNSNDNIIRANPINSNNIFPITFSIPPENKKQNAKKKKISYENIDHYIEELKKFLENFTESQIKYNYYNNYIKNSSIRPYEDLPEESKILILTIFPNLIESLVKHKNGKYYGRSQVNGQTDYGSRALKLEDIKKRNENREINRYKKFFEEIKQGNMGEFRFLLEKYPELINKNDVNESSALMIAAHYGQESFVESLLELKFKDNINFNPNYEGKMYDDISMALFAATYMNQTNIVKLLLKKYPGLIIRTDKLGNNIFFIAFKCDRFNVMSYILEKFYPESEAENRLTRDDLEEVLSEIYPEQTENEDLEISELVEKLEIWLQSKIQENV